MIALALVLLILVAVFSVAIVVSNPAVYELSLFRVLVPVTSAGVFFTGFGAGLVTVIALLLLRTGIRRNREQRSRLRTAEQAAISSAAAQTTADSDPEADSGREWADDRDPGSSLDLSDDRPPSTPGPTSGPTSAEGRTTVAGADDRDEPRL